MTLWQSDNNFHLFKCRQCSKISQGKVNPGALDTEVAFKNYLKGRETGRRVVLVGNGTSGPQVLEEERKPSNSWETELHTVAKRILVKGQRLGWRPKTKTLAFPMVS